MKKAIALSILLINACLAVAQQPAPNFTISTPITTGSIYTASEYVKFTNGASFKGTDDASLRANIDPYLIFPPTAGLTGGPNAGDNGVVGTIEGQGSVGPMGNYIYTIPLKLPECIPGMTPGLSLVYNSSGGDGYLGHGWSLGGLSSISRTPSNIYYDNIVDPVDFDENDRLALDGSRLIAVSGSYWGTDAEYRFEAENQMKVVPNGGGFKVYSPDGKISYYGSAVESRIWKPYGSSVQWFLDKIEDVFGNTIKIEYYHNVTSDGFSVVPKKISYNFNPSVANFTDPVYSVEFVYMDDEPTVKYSNQAAYHHDRVIETIVIKNGESEISHYDLAYDNPFYAGKLTIDNITYASAGNVLFFNPTRFLYSNVDDITQTHTQTQGFAYSCSGNGYDVDYLPGDFNGDGYTDFIRQKSCWDADHNFKVINSWDLLINNRNGGYTLRNSPQSLGNLVAQGGWVITDGVQLVVGNFNGDNKSDLAVFYDTHNLTFASGNFNDYEAANFVQVLIADGSEGEFINNTLQPMNFTDRIYQVLPADVNGDGLQDMFINTQRYILGFYEFYYRQYCFLSHINSQNEFSFEEVPIGTSNAYNKFRDFYAINFDGDNKQEVAHRDYNESGENPGILSFDPGTNVFSNIHSGPSRWKYIFYGDYNGDGITDLLQCIPTPDWDSQIGEWHICYGTGSSYSPEVVVTFGIDIKPGGHKDNSTGTILDEVEYIVGDYNGDGMDDILESYRDHRNSSNTQYIRNFYFSNGSFDMPQTVKQFTSSWDERTYVSDMSYAADINGDNKEDLVSGMAGELHFYCFGAGEPEGLLKQIDDGFGVKTTISYSPGKSSSVYSNQLFTLYDDTRSKIFNSSMPGYIVNHIVIALEPTIIASDKSYHYFTGMFHREGKGFLGYDMVRVHDNLNNLRSLTKTKIFTDNTATYSYIIPEMDHQVNYRIQEGDYLNLSQTENSYTLLSGKRYRVSQSKQLTKTRDLLENLYTGTSRVVSNFDTYGQLVDQSEGRSASELDFTSPDDAFEHRTETNSTYIAPANNLFGRPDVVTKTDYYKAPGASSFTSYTAHSDFAYYALSQVGYPLAKEVLQYADAATDPMAVKKAFEYNALGLLKKETLSAPNYVAPAGASAPVARVTEKLYDDQRPYLVLSAKDAKGYTTHFEYDPFELYVSTTTDINGLVTQSQSDVLGVQSMTTHPEGTKQVACKRWATVQGTSHPAKPDGGLYYTWSKTSGSAEMLTFYNALGQELRSVTCDAMGNIIYADKTYDSRGRLLTQTAPYLRSTTPGADITTTFSYDLLDRVRVTTTARGNASVDYEGFKTTYIDLMGHVTSRLVNAAGWLTESKDASGNSVKYLHDCRGNVTNTWHSSQQQATEILNEYDSHGNCTRLIDPAAGTIDFGFDPFDQMVTRKDSRQATPSIYSYDLLGRMTSRTEPEGTTTWTYDNKPHGLGQLGSVSFTNHNTQYTYDDFSRVSGITDQIKESSYTSLIAYDVYGREKKKTYPTGLVILTEYAANGQIGKLYKGGQDAGLIWAAVETDNYGRLTKTLQGSGALACAEFEVDRGLLTKQWTVNDTGAEIFRREYDWANGGNLNWRKKIISGTTLTESFTYDNLDRLDVTILKSNNTDKWSQNLNYDPLGNIDMKLEYPQGYVINNAVYGEDINNPYAITSADINAALWPQAAQAIAYNSYNKMTTVTEGDYQLNISYGYDHQRTYQELKQNGVVVKKKTFAGNGLEIIEKPGEGTVQKIHYLTGGDGTLFAIYVIDQNNEGKMYYIYTDHLGSPNLITDATGNVVQELSYDAWGKRRDPATWEPFTGTPEEPLIDRGFTFHEHLYPFTLINMNGRAYDPLVGRFLSADPYIQAPDNTQNLNRYSYCLNNPLRYNDPSGEFLNFLVGAVVGGIANWIMSGCDFNAKGLMSFGIGAVAGVAGFGAGQFAASYITVGGFAGGFATGFVGGAAGGFVGGIGYSWANGGNFADGLNAGLAGAGVGSIIGGLMGGIVRGGLDHAAGYDFWDGSKTNELVVGSTQNEKLATGYNSSSYANDNDEFLRLRTKAVFGVSEGDFNIRDITTKTGKGYGLTNSGEYVNLESKNLVAGYARNFTSGYCDVHISPYYSNGSAIDFRAVTGHELIHAYHNYVLPNVVTEYTERVAYKYTHDVYMSDGRISTACSVSRIAMYTPKGCFWGAYPAQYEIPSPLKFR
ncbi:MAG TPA: hypothetical protein DEO70_05715 [Bacteroidales bacterium]|nr:MAG: hypothetical protein A2X11_10870 [Bacteroidetes bacterium GWE2_42_24]OFY32049.1 MAG: hypothetical protein A2X09_10435 [Bacteroidetes bacterium GWF2_43_11]HBZ66317.1 hypothetical protein [Bacteroidales bacterium]